MFEHLLYRTTRQFNRGASGFIFIKFDTWRTSQGIKTQELCWLMYAERFVHHNNHDSVIA
jgi:hypothetical protein